MALNKNSGFGLDIEGRIKRPQKNETPDTHTHTDTDTYTDNEEYGYQYKKETKSKRLYLLTKPSVHKKLDDYAKAHDDTLNNLIHTLMEKFIDENGL